MAVYCKNCRYYRYFRSEWALQHECHHPKNMYRKGGKHHQATAIRPAYDSLGSLYAGKANEINKDNNCPDYKGKGPSPWKLIFGRVK